MTAAAQRTDRRVQRTHEALLDSLRVLMSERGYERLTIQNILDHADVSRATFYAHFSSKDDLLTTSIGGLRGWLLRAAAARSPEPLGFTQPLLLHLESHKPLYRRCIRRGEVTVGRAIRTMLRDMIRDDLGRRAVSPRDAAQVAMTTEYLTGALWSVIAYWMATEPEMSAVEVDRTFRRLVFEGVHADGAHGMPVSGGTP